MKYIIKLIKKVGLRKGIKLKKDAFHNLSTELEAVFYHNLDDIDMSKCDKITVSQYRNLIVVECYRLNGYMDRYDIGKQLGVSASMLNGLRKWR